jgi:hypothetical protein
VTSLIAIPNNAGPALRYVNSAPSTAITNTASETIFDTVFTLPSQTQYSIQPPSLLRLKCWGILSTGLLNLGLTINIRMGGLQGAIIATTGAITLAASLANAGWKLEAACLITSIGAGASMQAQGYCDFSAGALNISGCYMPNSGPLSLNTLVSNDVVVTATWATASASNVIQSMITLAELHGP